MNKMMTFFTALLCFVATLGGSAHAATVNYNASATYVPGGQGGGGLIQSITYPSGKTLTYQYDPTGLITTMLWNGQPVVANLQWNALELPTGWTWPFANTNATRVYNSAAQLQQSELFAYEFTPGGLVKKITQQLQAPMKQGAQTVSQPWTVVTNITHGIMGISDVTHTPGTITLPTGFVAQDIIGPLQASYTYDDNGNRTRAVYQQWGGSMGTNLLTRDMHLVAGTNKIGKVYDHRNSVQSQRTLTWDDSGRMTSDGDNTFHYDVMGRTTAITNSYGGGTLTFLTNALYQRTRKQQGNLVYDYFYGEEDWGMGQSSFPLGMYFTNKTTQQKKATEYLYLPTPMGPMPIAVDMGGTLYAIHTDHLLTPRRLTDSNGQAVWQWPVTAFGELEANNASTGWIRSRIGSAGAIANTQDVEFALRYPGQQFDKETGLMYNHHRYYDPYLTVGYTETDPIGLAGGWNRLRSAGGDGINNFDPTGLSTYVCTQPLHSLGTFGRFIYSPPANPFYHKFIGILRPDNSVFTGGQDRASGPWGPGRPSQGDAVAGAGAECHKVANDNECLEACLIRQFSAPRPYYSLGFQGLTGGQNCQGWADVTLAQCQLKCKGSP